MGQNVPLCDSPYGLPHLIVAGLLGEVLRYIAIALDAHSVKHVRY